jgi:saccharopine dehydrogenase-like NADP-dependent oxidoreductase
MEGPIAVVGGSGKLAGCCIRKLLSENRNVIAVGRDVSKMQDMYGSFPSLSFATGDVSQPEALKEALRGSNIYILYYFTYACARCCLENSCFVLKHIENPDCAFDRCIWGY